jgi:hypothetical protein
VRVDAAASPSHGAQGGLRQPPASDRDDGHTGLRIRPRATATIATVGCPSAPASGVRRRAKAVDNSPAAAIISPVPGRGTVRGEAPAASEKGPSVTVARRTPLILDAGCGDTFLNMQSGDN